ncbi:MAG: hypothetical protein GTO08_09815 [Deltaproteobacteria bacterium]|nr:hypothetical protein [Deltaproteobacteria bacterium]
MILVRSRYFRKIDFHGLCYVPLGWVTREIALLSSSSLKGLGRIPALLNYLFFIVHNEYPELVGAYLRHFPS